MSLPEPDDIRVEITDPKATAARLSLGACMATDSNLHLPIKMQSIVRSSGYQSTHLEYDSLSLIYGTTALQRGVLGFTSSTSVHHLLQVVLLVGLV